jgi:hypothetical protein
MSLNKNYTINNKLPEFESPRRGGIVQNVNISCNRACPLFVLLYQPMIMMDGDECGAVGGMRTGRGN